MKFFKKFDREYIEKNKWAQYTIATCAAAVVFVLLTHIHFLFIGINKILDFFMPVIVGGIIAYTIDPLVDIFQNKLFRFIKHEKVRRYLSIFLAFSLIFGIFIIIMISLIPQLVSSVIAFIGNIEEYKASIYNLINSFNGNNGNFINYSQIDKFISKIISAASKYFTNDEANIIETSFFAGKRIFNGIVGIIISIYILASKKRIKVIAKRLFRKIVKNQNRYNKTLEFSKACDNIITKFIWFDIIDALIIGVANFIFMEIFGIPYSILVSVVVAVANMVPTFGPLVGGLIGAFIILLASPANTLSFIIFTLILQTIDGYILKPKLFEGALGVSSIWILISIVVGGRIMGIPGIILGVPFAAIINYAYKFYLDNKKDKQ